jgi:PAS domain-containing protein
MSSTRKLTPWFYAALVAQVLLLVGDVASDQVFTTVYLLPPLALALVERPRPVAIVAALGVALAIGNGIWNDDFLAPGHLVRCAIVAVAGALAVLSAQARSGLSRSQDQAVGARQTAEAVGRRLDAMLGALAEAVTVNDEQGNILYANDAAVRLLEAESVDEILRSRPGEMAARFIVTKEDGSPMTADDLPGRHAAVGQDARPLVVRSVSRVTGASRWTVTKATSFVDEHGRTLALNVIEDVTEAKEAELRQSFLADAAHVLSSSLDYDETLQRIAWLTVPTFADWCAVDIFESGAVERVALAHPDPDKLEMAQRLGDEYPPDMTADAGLGAVIRTGRSELYAQIPEGMIEQAAQDERHLELVRALELRSAMVVPMRAAGATLGALTFVNTDSARAFDEDDLAFAEDLAARAGTAVENSRLYTRLAQTADTLQQSLLPERLAQPPGWRIAASYRPGERGTEVGGDFYDVFEVEDGWMVVLGDVTGKGVKAAALTSLARFTAKTAARFEPQPSAVMRHVNAVLREQPELSIVTAVCALLRPSGAGIEVSVVSAGHPLPLRVGADGAIAPIGSHDVVLGAVDDGSWTDSVAGLAPGDTLFFYTDGVTDTIGEGERFGEERLIEAAGESSNHADRLIARLEQRLDAFQASDRSDDRAMLAVEWVGVAEPAVAR